MNNTYLKKKFKFSISENIKLKKKIMQSFHEIIKIIDILYTTISEGNKVFICGNGGSAADAQHLSAEFLVRLKPKKNRRAYPIVSLALDTSTITACGNDYGFRYIFSRNLSALANKKDILIVMSTSGNSNNILEVLDMAKKMGIKTLGFLGFDGGKAKARIDVPLVVPSKNVARIQETHIFLGHFILEQIERKLIKHKI